MTALPCQQISEVTGNWWTSDLPAERQAAIRLCWTCPARLACAKAAVAGEESTWVWAGFDLSQYRERRALRRAMNAVEEVAS